MLFFYLCFCSVSVYTFFAIFLPKNIIFANPFFVNFMITGLNEMDDAVFF